MYYQLLLFTAANRRADRAGRFLFLPACLAPFACRFWNQSRDPSIRYKSGQSAESSSSSVVPANTKNTFAIASHRGEWFEQELISIIHISRDYTLALIIIIPLIMGILTLNIDHGQKRKSRIVSPASIRAALSVSSPLSCVIIMQLLKYQ